MKTEIESVKGSWIEILNDARFTVGKEPLPKEPSEKFKKEILISEHSPIRSMSIKWIWRQTKNWVAVHWVRHKWEKFISTQRSDRTNINRDKLPQDNPVNFKGEANIQHLIDTSRKRLCATASPETRQLAESLKRTIHDEVDTYIADVLVPNCVYRGGCPEPQGCPFWDKHFAHKDFSSIQERYDYYNSIFYNK